MYIDGTEFKGNSSGRSWEENGERRKKKPTEKDGTRTDSWMVILSVMNYSAFSTVSELRSFLKKSKILFTITPFPQHQSHNHNLTTQSVVPTTFPREFSISFLTKN